MPEAIAATDREIVISRIINAPRELVFEAFTDPEGLSNWWGPNGFTTTTHEMDVRPGGAWRFTMHGPDGVDYKNKVVYFEVLKPQRLVYTHSDDGEGGVQPFHATITFGERDGKTEITLRMLCDTAEQRQKMADFGAVEGGKQTLERLEAYLATRSDREG